MTNQCICRAGKEYALKKMFLEDDAIFGYLALGYSNDIIAQDAKTGKLINFEEIENKDNYSRAPLESNSTTITAISDSKVQIEVTATFDTDNINVSEDNAVEINQFAICDRQNQDETETIYFGASSCTPYAKSNQNALTFVINLTL